MSVHALIARADGAHLARIEVDSADTILEFRPSLYRLADVRLIEVTRGWHATGESTMAALNAFLAENHGTAFELVRLGEA